MITIAAIPTSSYNVNPYPAGELFSLLVAWATKLYSFILKFFKGKSILIYKALDRFVLNHPWFGGYLIATSCALFIFNNIAKEYEATKTNLGYLLKILFIVALSFFMTGTFFMLYEFLQKYPILFNNRRVR